MLDNGDIGLAAVYISTSMLLGLLAVPIGVKITARFTR
jgi:fluoride ion exporter CrcB/FEX